MQVISQTTEALKIIEDVMNGAIKSGIIQNMQDAATIFNAFSHIKNVLTTKKENDEDPR
jgi:hypothetical protein